MVVRRSRNMCDSLDAELGLRRTLTKKLVGQRRQTPVAASLPMEGAVARVSTAPLKEGVAASLNETYSAEAKVMYMESPGFIGSLLLLDREGKTARSITLWDGVADMNAAADHPQYGAVMSRLVSSFAEMPESQTWQLSAAFFRDGATPEIEHARRCGTQVE